jgi:hypothetical protein
MTIDELLAPLNPNEDSLRDLFRVHLDESMVREIAAADYGWKADECYQMLLPVWHTGAAPDGDFNLREVLELIRWSDPADPEWAPGGHGSRGHWMRLFASAGLLRLAPRYRREFDGECQTLAQFTASAIELGEATLRPAASLLAWRFLAYPGEVEDRPFLAFAILLLAASLNDRQEQGPWLKALAEWVEAEESQARAESDSPSIPGWGDWLFGLTYFRKRESVWRAMALGVLARPATPHPPEAADELRLIGEVAAGI